MKRALSILTVIALLACLISGCSGSKQPTETAAPAADPAPAEAAAPAEEPAAAPEAPASADAPEAPAPSEEVYEKVAYELPLFPETVQLSVFYALRGGASGNSFPNRDELEFWKVTQEKLNVDLVFQEPGEAVATEKYNLMCASGDLTDLICENMLATSGSAYTGGFDRAIADGVYIDLLPYVEEYSPNYAYYILGDEVNRKNAVTDEGHIATFLQTYSEDQLNNMGLAVNADYMDATGLELPDSVDTWLAVWQAMADNGVKYPVEASSMGALLQGSIAQAMGASIDTGFLIDAETSEFVFAPTTAETRAYIELFRQMNQNGWIAPDWMNVSSMDRTYFNGGEVPTRNMMINEFATYEQTYGIRCYSLPVVHAEGFDGNKTAMGTLGDALVSSNGGIAVSTCCADVESAMRFVDWFYSDEGADAANMGWEEGVLFEVVDGEKRVTEKYQQKNEDDMEYKNFLTHDGDFALCYPNMRYDISSDEEKKIYDMWASDTTNEAVIYYSLPQAVSLTSSESEDITSSYTDMDTYIESTVFGWLSLETELTDDTWQEYVSTCESMRLAEIQEVYEAAYQRYLNK